ncbi:MAG: hypothetical protein KDD47_24235, partial [Acidobacteria bacterium]|nr:hypothetical protein [Acidobacteriota bacterium]
VVDVSLKKKRVRERLGRPLGDPGLGPAFLEALDRKREEDPDAAEAEALWAVGHLPRKLLPHLLGVGGSTYKLQMRQRAAYHALHFGLTLAREAAAPLQAADLLQRLGYVVSAEEDYQRALELAEQAAWIYLRHGQTAGVGKALVDQGIWLHYLGRTQEAIPTQEAALELLPAGPGRNRCAAHQCLAQFHFSLGRLEPALAHIEQAEALKDALGLLSRAKIVWLKAGILEAQGKVSLAESQLLQAIESLSRINPVDTALATCDLVALYLRQRRPTRAWEATRSMLPLLEPLRHHKVVSSAIAELLRCEALALDLESVEEVRGRIAAQRRQGAQWQRLRPKLPEPGR